MALPLLAIGLGACADDDVGLGSAGTTDGGSSADGSGTGGDEGTDTGESDPNPDPEPDPEPEPLPSCTEANDRALFIRIDNGGTGPTMDDAQTEALEQEMTAWFEAISYGQFCLQWERTPWLQVDLPDGDDGPKHPAVFCALLEQGMTPDELEAFDRTFIGYTQAGTAGNPTGQGSSSGLVLEPDACFEGSPALDLSGVGAAKVSFIGPDDLGISLHEIGHTLGFGHASFVQGMTGSNEPYADLTDVMGSISLDAGFNAARREAVGWIGDEGIVVASTDGVYALDPLAAASGVRTVRVPAVPLGERIAPEDSFLGFEFRDEPEFSDVFNVHHGIQVRQVSYDEGEILTEGLLVETTPETPSYQTDDATLMWGRSYTHPTPDGYVTVTPHPGEPVDLEIHFHEALGSVTEPMLEALEVEVEDGRISARLLADAVVGGGSLRVFWNLGVRFDGRYGAPGDTHVTGADVDVTLDPDACDPDTGCRLWALLQDGEGGELWAPLDLLDHVNTPPSIREDTFSCLEYPGGLVRLLVEADDPDQDLLRFQWEVPGFDDPLPWVNPQFRGQLAQAGTVRVRVSDDMGHTWSDAEEFAFDPSDCDDRQ